MFLRGMGWKIVKWVYMAQFSKQLSGRFRTGNEPYLLTYLLTHSTVHSTS